MHQIQDLIRMKLKVFKLDWLNFVIQLHKEVAELLPVAAQSKTTHNQL